MFQDGYHGCDTMLNLWYLNDRIRENNKQHKYMSTSISYLWQCTA